MIERKVPTLRMPQQPKPAVVTSPTSLVVRKVEPRETDPFMDTVRDVKDLKGNVVFQGTLRQWAKQAREKEDEYRSANGLLPRGHVKRRLSHKQDTSAP